MLEKSERMEYIEIAKGRKEFICLLANSPHVITRQYFCMNYQSQHIAHCTLRTHKFKSHSGQFDEVYRGPTDATFYWILINVLCMYDYREE